MRKMFSIWSTFEQKSDKFFIRFSRKPLPDGKEEITCWLTDLRVVYSESLSGMVEVMERVKNENPFLLLPSDIEKKVMETISALPKMTATSKADRITFTRATNRLQLKYLLSESVPLKFHWTLNKCDETAFFEIITVPLLRQLVYVEEKTRNLVDIIKRKDLEIEQYKLDGALPLTRKQFVTERFDANQMKAQAKPLFDCSVSDLLLKNTITTIEDIEPIQLNVSSGPRASETSNIDRADDLPPKIFISKRPKANKLRRNRGYDEKYTGPQKVQYANSDDQSDENNGEGDDDDADIDNIVNVSHSTAKSDCSSNSNSSSSSTTKTTADSNIGGEALSTKIHAKRPRKKLNL